MHARPMTIAPCMTWGILYTIPFRQPQSSESNQKLDWYQAECQTCSAFKHKTLPGTLHSGPYHPSSQLQKYVPLGACSQVPRTQGPWPSHPAWHEEYNIPFHSDSLKAPSLTRNWIGNKRNVRLTQPSKTKLYLAHRTLDRTTLHHNCKSLCHWELAHRCHGRKAHDRRTLHDMRNVIHHS